MIKMEHTLAESPSKYGPRLYTFDAILSRDGLFFMKDRTPACFKTDYFREKGASYYEENIPLHRIFKTAYHFVKTMFHRNYHHPGEHDAFLPMSNLHHARSDDGFRRLIKHQLDAFLAPIIKIKRELDNKKASLIMCGPEGVLSYFEAFVNILEKNRLYDDPDLKNIRELIKTQKEEYAIRASDKTKVRESFVVQKNFGARLAVSFVFLLASIEVTDFLFKCTVEHWSLSWRFLIALCGMMLGLGIQTLLIDLHVYRSMPWTRPRKFRPFRRLSFADSDLKKGKLSWRYRWRVILLRYFREDVLVFSWISLIIFVAIIIAAVSVLFTHLS